MPVNNVITAMTRTIVTALEDIKGQDIVILDVNFAGGLFSRLIVATGTSTRQVKSLGKNVVLSLKAQGYPVLGIEGLENGEWVLVDGGEIIVHTMQAAVREFYDLEGLWQDPAAFSDTLRA